MNSAPKGAALLRLRHGPAARGCPRGLVPALCRAPEDQASTCTWSAPTFMVTAGPPRGGGEAAHGEGRPPGM